MGKASKKRRAAKKHTDIQVPMRSGPNLPLLGLALIGMGLAAYLTFSYWAGEALAGCTPGSACDIVLSSRWSKLFGLPTSLWGFLAYAALGGISFIRRADIHWKLACTVSLFGALYSLYLTGVSVIVLSSACPYCLASLLLLLIILGMVTAQRPKELPGFAWRSWLLKSGTATLGVVLAVHLNYAGIWGASAAQEDPQARALAEHLTKTDAKFYGAYWCPHCEEQKELFGASAHRLPYIECSPGGRRASQAAICNTAGVRVFPTWFIDGQRHEGLLSLQELARLSGFKHG
ncbi:MAG: vitamin K epoxide reductase family protein [Deltaproteobacteria bacterium]|nr:vitamin K epoxide reductase family protein [Deltaproteobacteria bacterium]